MIKNMENNKRGDNDGKYNNFSLIDHVVKLGEK